MKWNEIREIYPNQWVKLLILSSHETNDKEYIDEMEVLKNFTSDDEATDALVDCTDKEILYHTNKDEIYSEIRNIFFSYRNGRM